MNKLKDLPRRLETRRKRGKCQEAESTACAEGDKWTAVLKQNRPREPQVLDTSVWWPGTSTAHGPVLPLASWPNAFLWRHALTQSCCWKYWYNGELVSLSPLNPHSLMKWALFTGCPKLHVSRNYYQGRMSSSLTNHLWKKQYPIMFKIGQIRIKILGVEDEVPGQWGSVPGCFHAPFSFLPLGQNHCLVFTRSIYS